MQRPLNMETERLVLVVLLPEDLEALIAGDLERAARLAGYTFMPDPELGEPADSPGFPISVLA
jgi:hypothetical protein